MILNSVIYLAVPCGMQDFSSLTEDRACAPCNGSTEDPREAPPCAFFQEDHLVNSLSVCNHF